MEAAEKPTDDDDKEVCAFSRQEPYTLWAERNTLLPALEQKQSDVSFNFFLWRSQDEESVKDLTEKDLLKGHIERAKKVRAR